MLYLSRHILFIIAFFTISISVQAQAAMSEGKRKLIAELVSVMKMDEQMAKITDAVLKGMQHSYPIGFNAAIDSRADLTAQEKDRIKAIEKDSFIAFSEKFRKRLPEVVDYRAYLRDTVYPLYDKFYTEQEIKDLITFYSTPTGQKVISTMPELVAESQASATRMLLPKVVPLIEELTKEELDKVAPPKPTKQPK